MASCSSKSARPLDDAALGGVAFLVVSLIAFAFPLVRSRRERHALETVYWAAGESSRRWAEAFGDGRVPANPKQALAWLAAAPGGHRGDPRTRASSPSS